MDASGVALVIIGPGSVDQVCPGTRLRVCLFDEFKYVMIAYSCICWNPGIKMD